MQNMESQMQASEESAELNRIEIEENENNLLILKVKWLNNGMRDVL